MNRRRDFLAIAAGAVGVGTVLPLAAKAEAATALPTVTRDANGHWPRDIFPPGMHPADYHGPAIPDEPDDDALIAACAEFGATERHINSLYPGGANVIKDDDERDRVIFPIWEAQKPSLERVCGLHAVTLEGLQARARTIVLQDLNLNPAIDAIEGESINDRLVAALLRDLLAMGDA